MSLLSLISHFTEDGNQVHPNVYVMTFSRAGTLYLKSFQIKLALVQEDMGLLHKHSMFFRVF